jgi:ParB family chromosome partitioning protein
MAKLGMLKNAKVALGTVDSRSAAFMVKDIPIGDIQIKENIRGDYPGIDELAASIDRHGLLQPITVYADKDGFIVKTGHRRYMACRELYRKEPDRFHSIRCMVSDADNTAVIQLVENVQRVDLSQIDLFNALTSLREQGMTLKQIGEVMGKTEGYIKNLFIGINEVTSNKELLTFIDSHAGVTIQDITETKGIPDKQERLNLLEERKKGEINRAEMREKIKELKTPVSKKEAPDISGITAKQEKIHISVKAFLDLKKVIVYQVKGGSAEQLSAVEEDLRRYFSANKEKYHLEKSSPEGGANGN